MNELQHAKLLNALTSYDRRQSRGKYYNRNALGIYCGALGRAQKHCNNGAELRLSLLNCFNGRLLDRMLKAVDLPTSTKSEAFFGGFVTLPELDD